MKHSFLPLLFMLPGMLVPPCAWAARNGNAAAAQKFLQRKLSLMERSNSVYSILEAAEAGNQEVLAARLAENADPNEKDEAGYTPVLLAAKGKSPEVMKLLLDAGGDPCAADAEGRTASQLAKNKKIRKLLEKGVQARAREVEVDALVKQGDTKAVRKAIKGGVNPNARSADNKGTLLLTAVAARQEEMLRMLLSLGAKADVVRTDDGQSALHIAASMGHVGCIKALLEGGADPMRKKGNGASALHDAVWGNRVDSVRALLPAYSKVNFCPDGGYNGLPVNMAASRGNAEIVKLFLDAGMNLNDKCFRNQPPLAIAASRGHVSCVKLLVEAGADKNARDASGKTAADYATPAMERFLK